MNNYFELKISINPDIEDIVSDICFSNFACEGVVLAEEDWKDLEMTSTTRGTLKVFLTTPHPVSDHLLPQGAKGKRRTQNERIYPRISYFKSFRWKGFNCVSIFYKRKHARNL